MESAFSTTRSVVCRLAVVLSIALPAAACEDQPRSTMAADRSQRAPLTVERGPFERRWLLSGEVDAVSAAELKVPRVPMGKVTIRWLEVDGAPVKAAQRVAELDSAAFTAQLKDRAILLQQTEIELQRQEWQNQLAATDRALDLERKKTILQRAELDADVPPNLLPKKDYLDKQLALKRARAEVERAQDALETQQKTADLDVKVRRIALDKSARELRLLEESVKALTLRAPMDGTVIMGDHWEGRKLQVGDDTFVGSVVARMPDMTQMRVKAFLSDVDDGRVQPGMSAEVIVDAHPDRAVPAKILSVAPVARELSDISLRRAFAVTVVMEGGADRAWMRPGMSARIEAILEKREDAVLIPRASVITSDGRTAVRLLNGREEAVKLGPCNPDHCVALEGIAPGTPLARLP